MDFIDKFKSKDLTPVENYKGVFFKRDDLYRPFIETPDGKTRGHMVNGGKVRQAIYLLNNNYEKITTEHNNIVGTASGVKSPQLLIINKVSKEMGMKFVGVIGGLRKYKVLVDGLEDKLYSNRIKELIDEGRKVVWEGKELKETINDTEQSSKSHTLIRQCVDIGGDIRVVTTMSFNNVLFSRLIRISKEENNLFPVAFGINMDSNREAIISSTSDQVQNIPKDLDNLIVPVGSGITFVGILLGLVKYHIRPKRIIGVSIANHDRTPMIDSSIGDIPIEYNFYRDNTYPYSVHLNKSFIEGSDVKLSPIYESKAYEYAREKLGLLNGKTKDLFWIIGNEGNVVM